MLNVDLINIIKQNITFFVDNYNEEVWDGILHCIDMYYYIDLKDIN